MRRRPQHHPAYSRGFVRFALGFVASLITAGYFASLVHMALVAHTACAEHGRLVHVQDAVPTSGAVRGHVPASSASRSDALVSEEHDHCTLGTAQPSEARVAPAPLVVVLDEVPPPVAAPVRVHPSCERVEPPPQIALLFLSPKVSPPV